MVGMLHYNHCRSRSFRFHFRRNDIGFRFPAGEVGGIIGVVGHAFRAAVSGWRYC